VSVAGCYPFQIPLEDMIRLCAPAPLRENSKSHGYLDCVERSFGKLIWQGELSRAEALWRRAFSQWMSFGLLIAGCYPFQIPLEDMISFSAPAPLRENSNSHGYLDCVERSFGKLIWQGELSRAEARMRRAFCNG